MNLKQLLFLHAATTKQEENLLDYADLVNKTYSGDPSDKNVLPAHKITVAPGASMLLTGPTVTELMIRFYDEGGSYLSDSTITKWGIGAQNVSFTVPDNAAAILPKWNNSAGISVADLIAANPVIKYVNPNG